MSQVTEAATEVAPEILSLIFAKLPRPAQAACARVCKQWSEVALDELWRELDDVRTLLKLIVDDESFYDPNKRINNRVRGLIRGANWPRFRQYAIRVTSIKSWTWFMFGRSLPSEEAIGLVCLHHRFGTCLTPNVRRIELAIETKGLIALMMPFVPESLEELTLQNFGTEGMTESFLCLMHRTPNLKKLYIKSSEKPFEVSEPFSRWIQTCPKLEEVHLPRRWQISAIVTAFRSLPKLFEFGFQWMDSPDDVFGQLGMQAAIGEGCFPSLRRLGWSSTIGQARNLLRQTSGQLEGLTIDCKRPSHSSEEEVRSFLATVVECCPRLDTLFLYLPDIGEESEPLSLEIFRPLLACKTLTKLRVHHSCPCILSTADLDEMGHAWPTMEELVLCPDPDDDTNRGTPISRLPHVAAAFPRLRVLGLFFDHSEAPGPAGDLLPEIQFRSLRKLEVGSSQIPKGGPLSVGLYLSSLFGVGTRPSVNNDWSEARKKEFAERPVDNMALPTYEAWERVDCLAHLMLQTKEVVARRFLGS